jgi:hypothetical protein
MNPLALIQVILSRNTGIAQPPAIRRMTSKKKSMTGLIYARPERAETRPLSTMVRSTLCFDGALFFWSLH